MYVTLYAITVLLNETIKPACTLAASIPTVNTVMCVCNGPAHIDQPHCFPIFDTLFFNMRTCFISQAEFVLTKFQPGGSQSTSSFIRLFLVVFVIKNKMSS